MRRVESHTKCPLTMGEYCINEAFKTYEKDGTLSCRNCPGKDPKREGDLNGFVTGSMHSTIKTDSIWLIPEEDFLFSGQ